MITAVLDTNIFLQYLIGSPRSASLRTVDAYFDGRFRIAYSSAMVDELLDVLMLPRIRNRHGLTDAEILEYLAALFVDAQRYPGVTPVSPRITRDLTDTKFLSVAVEADAGYLVTIDRRHFQRLGQYRGTRVFTPTQFLRVLS